jgi:hypothetical protein
MSYKIEGKGSSSPKPPPKKKRLKPQAPKDKANKRHERLLDDEDVQELLQEERAADFRAMMDVD